MQASRLAGLFGALVVISLCLPLYLAAQDFRAFSVEKEDLGVTPRSCCAPTDGFSLTAVFMSPTEDDIPCFDCAQGVRARHMIIPTPRRVVRVGDEWSTHVMIDSNIPGPCRATVTWLKVPSHEIIYGPITSDDFDDCSSLTGIIEFFNRRVPNERGPTVAMVTAQAGDGREVVEWEFFEIR